ncbi:eIF-5a domain-containing protein [Balamuthia mandrillaris]
MSHNQNSGMPPFFPAAGGQAYIPPTQIQFQQQQRQAPPPQQPYYPSAAPPPVIAAAPGFSVSVGAGPAGPSVSFSGGFAPPFMQPPGFGLAPPMQPPTPTFSSPASHPFPPSYPSPSYPSPSYPSYPSCSSSTSSIVEQHVTIHHDHFHPPAPSKPQHHHHHHHHHNNNKNKSNDIDIPKGKAYIKTFHNTFISARKKTQGCKPHFTQVPHMREWEHFGIIHLGGNRVALHTHHGTYVSARPNRTTVGQVSDQMKQCETFTVEQKDGAMVAFKTAHGTYLSAGSCSGSSICQSSSCGKHEKFCFVQF